MIGQDQEDKCMPDTLQELERERQGIFRQIDELGDFRAGSITGKSAGCPAYKAGRKADPLIISTFPGSSALCLPVGRQGRGASLCLTSQQTGFSKPSVENVQPEEES